MRRYLFILVLIPLFAFGQETASGLDDPLDFELEELGVNDGAELRVLRGNFYYSYLIGDYYRTLYYLERWQTLAGLEDTPELEAEVMRAAVYLALGLETEAEQTFYQVFQQGGSASGDAWYFLAQRLFGAGLYERAELSARNALSAEPKVSSQNDQETRYLLSSSISQQDRIEEAEAALDGMRDKSIWTGYARYNLVLAMTRQNYKSQVLERVVDESIYYLPKTDEGTALRDRTLLISGIAAMERDKHKLANQYFREITLESVFSAPALLHYGWNLLAQWKYEDAIQPWRILQHTYDEYHPAVIESLLAVPHTLELVDAVNQSVLAYERIEDTLSVMVDELKAVNQAEGIKSWLGEWRANNAVQDWGWQRQALTDLQDSEVTRFTQGLLDDDLFVRELETLHDLDRIYADLLKFKRDLALWADILVQRRERLEAIGGDALLDSLEERQMDVLRATLAVQDRLLDEEETVFSYASRADKVRVERLRNVVPAVTHLQKVGTPTRNLNPYKERWRRMRGLQLWAIYEAQPQRQWDTQRDHMIMRAETDKLFAQLENTRTSLVWADSSWRGFPERVNAAQTNVDTALERVEALQQRQETVLTEITQNYLTELDERLTLYLAQSRLALARLYDDSLQNEMSIDMEETEE
jgi:tetratricopeptide (TPR) repeat protein